MKLSLKLISKELSDSVNDIHLCGSEDVKVSYMKILYNKDDFLNQDFVYLCQPKQLEDYIALGHDIKNQNFIIYANNYENLQTLLCNSNYLLISKSSSFFYFINTIEAIFTSYNRWEQELTDMGLSHASLQDMLDLAYAKIKIPMCILNINHQVLAINQSVKTTDILFQHMQEGYGYPCIDLINKSNPKLSDLNQESVSEVINSVSHNRLRVSTIKSHGSPVFYIGLHKQDQQPFDCSTLELYGFFVNILFSWATQIPTSQLAFGSLFDEFISDLIQKSSVQPDIFNRMLNYFEYKQYGIYQLTAISLPNTVRKRPGYLSESMHKLSGVLSASRCFYLEPYIGILTAGEPSAPDYQRLRSALHEMQANGVISYRFRNFSDIHSVWPQLTFILELPSESNGDPLQTCDHYIASYCAHTIAQNLPCETLLHPYFIPLRQYDAENNTEYLDTLISYLQNNCSISATANALYIHRNSLQYRIRKIEEILDIKISSSNERLPMLFSSFFVKDACGNL